MIPLAGRARVVKIISQKPANGYLWRGHTMGSKTIMWSWELAFGDHAPKRKLIKPCVQLLA